MVDYKFVQFTRDSSRTVLIGNGARDRVPANAIEQDQGSFRPHFLLDAWERWTIAHPGEDLRMRVNFTKMRNSAAQDDFKLRGLVGSAMWPSMSSGSIVSFEAKINEIPLAWGEIWDILGLEFKPGNKGFKRLNEVTRPSRIWSTSDMRIAYIDGEEREDLEISEMAADGMSFIRRSTAIECCNDVWDYTERVVLMRRIRTGEITRITNFRVMGPEGLIKGHAIIVDDRIADRWGKGVDIITDRGNLKTELRFTSDRYFTTFEPLKATGEVEHDIQTRAWMKNFLTTQVQIRGQIDTKFTEVIEALDAGEIPDWMQLNPDYYLRSRPTYDTYGDQKDAHDMEVLYKTWLRASAHGLDIRCSAAITSLLAQGCSNLVSARLSPPAFDPKENPEGNPVRSDDPKIFAPAEWAVYGYVVTRGVLEKIGGLTIEGDDSFVYYDAKLQSIVIPDEMYEANYHNHGGWDQDDRVMMFLNWSEEQQTLVTTFVRQPNAAGEYSQMPTCAYTVPWKNTTGPIPTLDESFRVPTITESGGSAHKDLPESKWVWGDEYTEADAREAIEVAFLNVASGGVGGYMNALMVAADMGINLDLHASPEQVVDVCQSTPYREFFKWNKDNVDKIWESIASYDTRVDKFLWFTKVPPAIQPKMRVRNGQFWMIWNHGVKALNEFKTNARDTGFKMRSKYRLRFVDDLTFSDRELEVARKAVAHYDDTQILRQQKVEKARRNKVKIDSPYREISGELAKMIIEAFTDEDGVVNHNGIYGTMIAIYKIVTTPDNSKGKPYGTADNLIFGPPPADEIGMFDLFLEALTSVGVVDGVYILKSGFYTEPELLGRLEAQAIARNPNHELSVWIGDEQSLALANVMALWAESETDREAIEAIRLLGLEVRRNDDNEEFSLLRS